MAIPYKFYHQIPCGPEFVMTGTLPVGLNTGSKAARAIQEILNDLWVAASFWDICNPKSWEILRDLRALNC